MLPLNNCFLGEVSVRYLNKAAVRSLRKVVVYFLNEAVVRSLSEVEGKSKGTVLVSLNLQIENPDYRQYAILPSPGKNCCDCNSLLKKHNPDPWFLRQGSMK